MMCEWYKNNIHKYIINISFIKIKERNKMPNYSGSFYAVKFFNLLIYF